MKCKNCCHYNICSLKERAEGVSKSIEDLGLNEDDTLQVKLICKEFLLNPKATTEPLVDVIKSNLDKACKVGKACKDICKVEYRKAKEQ